MEQTSVPDARMQWLLKNDGKVVVGKNGRLFLDNDRNQVVKQHTGELRFSQHDLRSWRRLLDNRYAFLEKLGIPYFFLVPPNAHSVFPEDLPDHIQSAPQRPVHQLMEHLAENGSFARIVYPLEQILSAKGDVLLYPLTDPHWSAHSAFIAYSSIAPAIASRVQMNQVEREDLTFHVHPLVGELGYKIDPRGRSEDVASRVIAPQAYLLFDNLIFVRGMKFVTGCPDAPDTTCLMLGDSFCGQLWNLFAASFRRFVFAHIPTLDYELVEETRPDVVVSVLNERFLIEVPDDVRGPTTREVAEEKAATQIRAEINLWPKLENQTGERGR